MIVEQILAYIDISIPRLYAPTLMQKMKEMTQSIFHFSIMNFNFFSPLCKFLQRCVACNFWKCERRLRCVGAHTYTGIKMRTYKLKSLSSCLQTPDGRKLCCCRASVNSNNPEKPGFSRPTTYLGVTSPPVCLFCLCLYLLL